MAEEIEGTEVTEYKLTPEILEAMLIATEILEKLSAGELTVGEALALYEEKVLPVIKQLQAKTKTSKSSKKKKTTSKKTKTKKKETKKAKKTASKKTTKKSKASSKSKTKKKAEKKAEESSG